MIRMNYKKFFIHSQFQGWLEVGRLEVAAFEPIKSKYEWIINQTECTR